MEEEHLHRPLLSVTNPLSGPSSTAAATTAATPNLSTSSIGQRLLLIIFIGAISVWANNEASKGFVIRVINDMKDTPAGNKFSLFYVSNDEASRLVQTAATFAMKILYADANSMPEKTIDQVDVRLSRHNMSCGYVSVTRSSHELNKYVLSISPLIMDFKDFRNRIKMEIQRGVAQMLLFDKRDKAPRTLTDGMVEYVSSRAGLVGLKPELRSINFKGKCWENKDPEAVAEFLGYCEAKSEGFIGRFYQAIGKDDWDEHNTLDNILGMTATTLCQSFHNSIVKREDPVASKSISSYR